MPPLDHIAPYFLAGVLLGLLIFSTLRIQNKRDPLHWAQRILQDAPFPIWLKNTSGAVWANHICADQYERLLQEKKPAKIIDNHSGLQRVEFDHAGALDFFRHKTPAFSTYFGLPTLDVKPKSAQLETPSESATAILQDIPIGVVGFGVDQTLETFNPALCELLNLPPSWMKTHPSLRSFLHRLHDDGFQPEPKDFKRWRDSLINLADNPHGFYQEHWYLPNSTVLKVTGRVRSSGEYVFWFEDASPYIFIERAYRQETAQFRSALDTNQDAIVLFDHSGDVIFYNAAFEDLWGFDANTKPRRAKDLMPIWQGASLPTPIWGDVRDDLTSLSPRSRWESGIMLKNGVSVDAIFGPIKHGGFVCQFRLHKTMAVSGKIA